MFPAVRGVGEEVMEMEGEVDSAAAAAGTAVVEAGVGENTAETPPAAL